MQQQHAIPQFKYWSLTLEFELTVLIFVKCLRLSDFNLYIDSLTQLVPWLSALDQTNYARYLPVHIRDMSGLESKHPEIANEFKAGKFTVQKTERFFSAIAIDHAHEQNNAYVKGDGGAVGLTVNPSALRRWMLAGPEITRIIGEFEDQLVVEETSRTQHHEQQKAAQTTFREQVAALVSCVEELGNPFLEESHDLLSLVTKDIADPAVLKTEDGIKQIGKDQYDTFVQERLRQRSRSFYDCIPKNKLTLFHSSKKKENSKSQNELTLANNDVALFSKLYIGCQNRDSEIDEFFKHENQAFPPSLSDFGKLRATVKSELLTCFEALSPPTRELPNGVSVVILDGAAIAQMLKVVGVSTFEQYANDIFKPYVTSILCAVDRVDIVWDSYKADSLMASTREKRGKGIRRRVSPSTAVPKNWQDFLRVDDNKQELFHYLSQCCVSWTLGANKEIVATDGEQVLVCPARDISSLAPCSHEEADTRMFVHAAEATNRGHMKIIIRTVDTDVVVLAISVVHQLGVDELWLDFGVGKNRRYLAAHLLSQAIGSLKSKCLPLFHSLTGCDTTSSFLGRGKRTAWEAWVSFPAVTEYFEEMSSCPEKPSIDCICTIERFIIILYDRTSTCTNIDMARKHLFTKKGRSMEGLPPTQAALYQHILRAAYQGGHVWGSLLELAPRLPSPADWGWIRLDTGLYSPLWTTIPQASITSLELVRCGCLQGCRSRQCKCVKAALQCTALCVCDGNCEH